MIAAIKTKQDLVRFLSNHEVSVSTSKSPSYEMSPGAAGIVVIRLPMGLD